MNECECVRVCTYGRERVWRRSGVRRQEQGGVDVVSQERWSRWVEEAGYMGLGV